MSLKLALGVVLLLVTWAIVRLLRMGSRQANLPPGPPTIPIFGNAHMFPTKQVHLQFTEWSKTYGDIYSLKVGDQTMVILSNPRLVQQLLDQRTATTSDRPAIHIIDIIAGGFSIPMMRYNQLWKDYRKALRELLSREACLRHLPIQRAEATQFMYDLLKEPENFFTHARRHSSSFILSVAFGIWCPRYKNSYISRFFTVQRDLDHIAGPGGTPPIDMFPILKYVPERWAQWKKTARDIRTAHRALWHELLSVCVNRLEGGKRQGCYMEEIWENREQYGFDREKIAYLGSNLMEAGSDTTAVFLQSFICLMTAFPDVRKRAQKEIDDVVGSSRSPVFEDWESLPYLQALIKEGSTSVGLFIVRFSMSEIGNYVLPEGSTVFVNLWGINHDSDAFDQPERFNPDRFLESEFGTRKGADDTGRRLDMVFGSGRRMCPGMELAGNSLKMNSMNMLWAFDFELAKDSKGEPIAIDLNDTTDGILLTQKPFKCSILPRSQTHIDIIRNDYREARQTFVQFETELTEDERTYVAEW